MSDMERLIAQIETLNRTLAELVAKMPPGGVGGYPVYVPTPQPTTVPPWTITWGPTTSASW